MMTKTTMIGDARIDAAVPRAMAEYDVPGLALGILDGGQRTIGAWGIANLETGAAMVPESVLQIGSITKIFTTTLLMGLVEDGRVSLDQPVVDLLPDFRLADADATRTVTLRHCLTHQTGFDGDRFDDQGRGDDALARSVAGYHTLHQQVPPGTVFSYCNTGFNVVGRVIEVLLGQPFEEAMRERVFAPLGLKRATFFADEAILMAAAGHLREHEQNVVARPYPLARNANPAGGVIADVDDLLTFAAAHLGGDVPAPFPSVETRRAMQQPEITISGSTRRGLGWQVERRGDEVVVGHGGSTNGFTASLILLPARQYAVATLTNGSTGPYTYRDIERAILKDRFGIEDRDPEPIPAPAGLADRLRGTYEAMLSRTTLAGQDDALTVQVTSLNPFTGVWGEADTWPVAPSSDDEVMATEAPRTGQRIQILPNAGGPVRMIRLGGRIAIRSDSD